MTASSSASRKAKEALSQSLEELWALGFSMAGRLVRSRVSHWSSPGVQRILVIAPHPDDEVIGCSGTIIRHKQCGDEVYVAYVSDGRRSRAFGLAPAEMAQCRKQEAAAAANALRIDHFEWFGLPEGEWTAEQLQPGLQALVNCFAPHYIYAPSRIDLHSEHHKVAHALATVLAARNGEQVTPTVRIYQVQVPLTPILSNLVADASDVMAESAAGLSAYITQRDSIARGLRLRRYAARFYGLKQQAEEFWQMSSQQYGRLHGTDPHGWPANRFRSIRFRPASDPLAYLRGLSERRRLAELASA